MTQINLSRPIAADVTTAENGAPTRPGQDQDQKCGRMPISVQLEPPLSPNNPKVVER